MPYRDRGKYRTSVHINGKRLPSRSFETKREAKEYEAELRKQYRKGLQDMALGDLIVKYLDYSEIQFMPETYKAKLGVMHRLLKSINKDVSVSEITRAMVFEHLTDLAKKVRPSKANEDKKQINAMFNWALQIYDIQYNPVAGIKKFKAEGKDLYTPPEEDVLKVLEVAEGEERVFLDCYLFTGAREQEINRLRWKDIDFEQKRICLWSRKTKSKNLEPQWIDLADKLSDSLMWWQSNCGHSCDYVFVNNQKGSKHYGQPYKNRNKLLSSLCKKAGVHHFGFHGMRRFVGSILAKSGEPMQVIQGVLRHQNLAHTEKYVRGLGIDMSSAMNILQHRLSPETLTQSPTNLRLVK